MPATQTHWTVDMVHALPDDGKRHEIIDGELFVTPSPSYDHQGTVLALAVRLRTYLTANRVGRVFVAPLDVTFGPRTLVQPDVLVLPLHEGRPPRTVEEAGGPLLAIEILSPSSAHTDRVRKRGLYQREGVPEYWIVDPNARVIERWRPEDSRPEILTETLTWNPIGAAEPLTFDLPELWNEVFGSANG